MPFTPISVTSAIFNRDFYCVKQTLEQVKGTQMKGIPLNKEPIISIVVAIAKNGVIGVKGGLPWKLSSDLKRFKRDTMGKPIIMGRKTFQSIGKALPGRPNIVVSRSKDFAAPGADVVGSIDEAIRLGNIRIKTLGLAPEICVIGGGELYASAIAQAERLYVTHVMAEPDGDTFFPDIEQSVWRPVSRENYPAGEKDSAETLYVVYERVESD